MNPSRSDFEKIHNWLLTNKGSARESVGPKRSPVRIYQVLTCMESASWDQPEIEFEIKLKGYGQKSYDPLVTDVKKYLRLASEKELKPHVMEIGKSATPGRYSIRWARQEDSEYTKAGSGESFDRIIVVGNLRTGEWNTEIMRGVRSMARELDIELVDRMERDWLKEEGTGHDPNPISGIVRQEGANPAKDAILVRNQDHSDVSGDIALLMSQDFHVITTGFTTGKIRQNLDAIGMKLAERCIEDQKQLQPENVGDGFCVIIHRYNDLTSKTTAIERMQQAFRATIKARSKFEIIDFSPSPYYGLHYDLMHKQYSAFFKTQMKNWDRNRLAAIFVPDESYGLAALHVFEKEDANLCRVYSERLVRSLLETRLIGNPHLRAACGMEPYYFGRYGLRAASVKRGEYPDAEPVLVTYAGIDHLDITSPDRIPMLFEDQDVQFNQERYAWYPWMRNRCRGSYGPDLLKKFRKRPAGSELPGI